LVSIAKRLLPGVLLAAAWQTKKFLRHIAPIAREYTPSLGAVVEDVGLRTRPRVADERARGVRNEPLPLVKRA
jgi:hypothetical protein